MWAKAKTGSKLGFDKLYGLVDKLGPPVNKLSNKVGAEAFWPTTLDKESDKAARILRSFCKDGFYEEEVKDTPDGLKTKQRVIKKIPAEVIKNAKGLAIFTVMRTGLWFSGAGGAGILVARLPDGSWSPPSGLMLHTAGLGFLVGVDIYDCVMVINTTEALEGFSKLRATVGGEMSAVAGPVGIGGVLDSEVHKRRAPIFTYLKSRGFYAGVQIDGTVLIERTDENEKFYGAAYPVMDILTGKVPNPPRSIRTLMQTIKAAQGEDVDESELPKDAPPSDFDIDTDETLFSVPDKMDPDPYGVLALEKEGLQLKEAGTQKRASHEVFVFNPSPSSPIYSSYNRNSIDGKSMSRRSSWRASTATTTAPSRPLSVSMATQTDFETPASPQSVASSGQARKMADIAEDLSLDARNNTDSATATNGVHHESYPTSKEPPANNEELQTPAVKDLKAVEPAPEVEQSEHAHLDQGDESDDEEAVIVQTVQQAATPQFINRARLVSVKKANAPALPPRNPVRERGMGLKIGGVSPRSDSSHEEETETRPSTERTRSSGSMTSVSLNDETRNHVSSHANEHEVDQKENEEFHSTSSTPAAISPELQFVDLAQQHPVPGQF